MPDFINGDVVQWESQSAGRVAEKHGTIVEVVPENSYPQSIKKRKGLGAPRNHESYVVRASVMNGSEAQKKRTKLYWPRVKQLTRIRTNSWGTFHYSFED